MLALLCNWCLHDILAACLPCCGFLDLIFEIKYLICQGIAQELHAAGKSIKSSLRPRQLLYAQQSVPERAAKIRSSIFREVHLSVPCIHTSRCLDILEKRYKTGLELCFASNVTKSFASCNLKDSKICLQMHMFHN